MYLVLFGVGAGFIIISLVIGELIEFEVEGVEGPSFFSFLRPTLVAVFLVVTGGVGMILTPNLTAIFTLVISVFSGLGVAGLINRFVLIPLHKAQSTSTFNMQDTIGMTAEIVSPIPQGGYGKIRYNISGSVVTSPAKSEDGNPVAMGERVDIIYIEKNTYYVRRQAEAVLLQGAENQKI